MKYIIRDREAGNKIAEFNTLEEAQSELKKFEESDKKEGTYTEDFYEIIGVKYEVSVRTTEISHVKYYMLENLTFEQMRKMVDAKLEYGDGTPDRTEDFDTLEEADARFEELMATVFNDYYPSNNLLFVAQVYIDECTYDEYGDTTNIKCVAYGISNKIRGYTREYENEDEMEI